MSNIPIINSIGDLRDYPPQEQFEKLTTKMVIREAYYQAHK